MNPLRLILADDDDDDCYLFKDALKDLQVLTDLKIVNDGVRLMEALSTYNMLPSALFLDLNMPRKNGFECLSEIRLQQKLMQLPVIIFSTSLEMASVKLLYEKGANYYIRKPSDFSKLKNVIGKVLAIISKNNFTQPHFENFILQY
jgi:CheY-like chemotaxis protein